MRNYSSLPPIVNTLVPGLLKHEALAVFGVAYGEHTRVKVGVTSAMLQEMLVKNPSTTKKY